MQGEQKQKTGPIQLLSPDENHVYDVALLGPVSEDHNVEPDGSVAIEIGGAIVYSPYAARAAGCDPVVLVKGDPQSFSPEERFGALGAPVRVLAAQKMTSIRNEYLDASHEQRISTMRAQTAPFTEADLEGIHARIYHLGGLIYGDFSDSFILTVSKRGEVALDAQCLLRHGDPVTGAMSYCDWAGKEQILPHVRYLKVDAKEAEILTGQTDRTEAARLLIAFGVPEVFISYHNEMLVSDGKQLYHCPYQTRSTIGRTGRGDTVFAAYLAQRVRGATIAEALRFATALVCLKMEKRGPFLGTVADVEQFIQEMGLQVHTSQA